MINLVNKKTMSLGGTGIVPQMYSGITDTQNIKYMVWDMNSTWTWERYKKKRTSET